jgi:hypothetical protein
MLHLLLLGLALNTLVLNPNSNPNPTIIENRLLDKNESIMGISIVLYRVKSASKFEQLTDLSKQMDKRKSVNLYKVTQDLGIIFFNKANPYADTSAIPYKIFYGHFVERQVAFGTVNGFLASSEVESICNWLQTNKLDSFKGFSKMYDKLSPTSKKELLDIGADTKEGLYNGYVAPLYKFYFDALRDKNAIVFCGE